MCLAGIEVAVWRVSKPSLRSQGEFREALEKLEETLFSTEYIDKKKAGLEFHGVKDGILSKALDKHEHAGRVRGVGGHVTLSTYLDRCTKKGTKNEILERLEKLEREVREVCKPSTQSSKNENDPSESPATKSGGAWKIHGGIKDMIMELSSSRKALGVQVDPRSLFEVRCTSLNLRLISCAQNNE